MNNNYMYISKPIISIILCLIFLSTVSHNIYASSEFLETNTEIKYEELIKCIKSHNNDISKCINHYKSYLKNEIKLIKSTSKNDKYNNRLTKMIAYLQKSTDVYHKKAKKNDNLVYWEKAANCAKLLSNISKKYSDYKIIVESYKQAKRGPSLSIHLKQKMKALDKYEYPSYEYLKELKRYVNNINNNLAAFKKVTIAELIKVGENVIQDNLEFFKYKLKSTKRHDLTIYDNAHLRYKIFKVAVKLPNIEKTKLENLNKTIKSTTKAFNIFTDYTLNLVYKNKEYYLNDKYENFLDSSKKVFDMACYL